MNLRHLPRELLRKAKVELNENPCRLQQDLDYVREWLQKQPHLKARTDDQWLVSFLRGCKFSLEKTKEKLDYFYTIRTLTPELFANRDPFLPEIQEILKAGVIIPLPKTIGKLGPRLIMIYYKNVNCDTMLLPNLIKVFFMISDILLLEDDDCVVSGICVWADFYELPFSHMTQFTPGLLKNLMLAFQSAYPYRIKGLYCTNVATFFEATFFLLKSFLNKKIKERMFMFSTQNFDDICDFVPKEFHPNDLEGNCGFIKDIATYWKKKVESYGTWYIEDERYGTDETKRVGSPKTSADIFGVDGSFRKLNVD